MRIRRWMVRSAGALASWIGLAHCGGNLGSRAQDMTEGSTTTRQAALSRGGPASTPTPPGVTPDCMPLTDTDTETSPPDVDSYVDQSQPTGRFENAPVLQVTLAPSRQETYLTFTTYPQPEPHWHARSAALSLYATDGTSNGPVLYQTSTDWPVDAQGNKYIDWNHRPALLGAPVGNTGAIPTHSTVSYDVLSQMTQQWGATYGFGLLPESSDAVTFSAMNSSSPPLLTFSQESDPYCTYRGTGGGHTGWVHQFGGVGNDFVLAMDTDAQGGLVTVGKFGDTAFPNAQAGFALARYDPSGTFLWGRTVIIDQAQATALAVTPEGNILVVGSYYGSPDLGAGALPPVPDNQQGLFLAKFSPTGDTVWTRGFVTTSTDSGYHSVQPHAVATDAQGSLVVVGELLGQVDLGGGPLSAGVVSKAGSAPSNPGGYVAKFTWQGQYVFSRALQGSAFTWSAFPQTVRTDAASNVLVGGLAGKGADLGDGALTQLSPYVARYTPTGALQWKRLFPGTRGTVTSVSPMGTTAVAFNANLGGSFTFAGKTYVGGIPGNTSPDNLDGYTATLSSTGVDGWIRDQGGGASGGRVWGVVADANTLTITSSDTPDLGGGALGNPYYAAVPDQYFIARYSASGTPLWSRVFDSPLGNADSPSGLPPNIALQPGGALAVATDFRDPVRLDGTTYTSHGDNDLLYFQLQP